MTSTYIYNFNSGIDSIDETPPEGDLHEISPTPTENLDRSNSEDMDGWWDPFRSPMSSEQEALVYRAPTPSTPDSFLLGYNTPSSTGYVGMDPEIRPYVLLSDSTQRLIEARTQRTQYTSRQHNILQERRYERRGHLYQAVNGITKGLRCLASVSDHHSDIGLESSSDGGRPRDADVLGPHDIPCCLGGPPVYERTITKVKNAGKREVMGYRVRIKTRLEPKKRSARSR